VETIAERRFKIVPPVLLHVGCQVPVVKWLHSTTATSYKEASRTHERHYLYVYSVFIFPEQCNATISFSVLMLRAVGTNKAVFITVHKLLLEWTTAGDCDIVCNKTQKLIATGV
jgi:hypothetical protein